MTELAHDYLDLDGLFSAEELEQRDRVRAVRRRADPAEHRRAGTRPAHFPRELVKELGDARRARHAPEGLRLRRAQRRRVRPGGHGAGGRRLRAAHVRLACRARWR